MPFNVNYNNEAISVLTELESWFSGIAEWIPPAPGWVSELLFGKLPEDNYADVYPLAEEWIAFGENFATFLEDSMQHGRTISSNWSGDGTPAQFGMAFNNLTMAVAELQMATAQMAMVVSRFGDQLEIGS